MALSNAQRQRRYRRRVAKRNARNSNGRNDGPFGRADLDTVLELLSALPRIRVGIEGYSHLDRARDFIAVFNGTSAPDQGRRVLSQIHQICDPASPLSDADKPGTLAHKAGMRRVMHEIMLCFVAREPMTVERNDDVRSV